MAKDKKLKVKLSDSGIEFFDEKKKIPWDSISEFEIKREKVDIMDWFTYFLFITIERKNCHFEVLKFEINDYSFNKNEIITYATKRINKNNGC